MVCAHNDLQGTTRELQFPKAISCFSPNHAQAEKSWYEHEIKFPLHVQISSLLWQTRNKTKGSPLAAGGIWLQTESTPGVLCSPHQCPAGRQLRRRQIRFCIWHRSPDLFHPKQAFYLGSVNMLTLPHFEVEQQRTAENSEKVLSSTLIDIEVATWWPDNCYLTRDENFPCYFYTLLCDCSPICIYNTWDTWPYPHWLASIKGTISSAVSWSPWRQVDKG